LAAAQNGDVDPPCQGCPLLSGSQQIDDFLAVPFHRLLILDPQIREIGYGSYTEGGLQAAVLSPFFILKLIDLLIGLLIVVGQGSRAQRQIE
jgi:hypothetical protein